MIVIKPLTSRKVVLHTAAVSFPIPTTVAEGASVSHLRAYDGHGPDSGILKLKADGATTLEPLALYAVDDEGDISFVTLINNGDAITVLSAAIAFSCRVNELSLATRLIVGGLSGTVVPTGGKTVTASITPLSTKET